MKRVLTPGKLRDPDLPKVGRPSRDELRERNTAEILERVANGEDLGSVCETLKMAPATFRGWCRESKVLDNAYQLARREYAHSLFDKIAELSARCAAGGRIIKFVGKEEWVPLTAAEVNALKAAIDGYKHVAARLNPAQYGEQKVGQQGVAVFINTTLPVGPGEAPGSTIDGDFTIVKELNDK